MNKLLPALALTLTASTLGGCATPSSPFPAGTVDTSYMALGTEPGWTLELTANQINYAGDYGETQVRVPVIQRTRLAEGMRYQGSQGGHQLQMDIAYRACNDGMSDRRFAHTVKLTVDGKTVHGCGGAILPPVSLDGTSWTIRQINDVRLQPDIAAKAQIRFDKGRATVTVGCNRMMGPYSAEAYRMTIGPLASTRLACPAPLGSYESEISALFAEPVHLRYSEKGGMTLMDKRSRQLLLEQSI